MVSKLPVTVPLLAGLALAASAMAQPSAPDPEIPDSREAPESQAASESRESAGTAPSPEAEAPTRPGSPQAAAARREEKLDVLFTRLAESDEDEWKRIQSEIWRMWSQSGSASMDLLLRRAHKAMEEQDDPELALRYLDDLVRFAPDFAEGWNRRATVHFQLGEYGKAVAGIERALSLEPRHFGALGGLAMILERLGDKDGAYEAYKRALEIHPYLPGAAKALERLAPDVEGREL